LSVDDADFIDVRNAICFLGSERQIAGSGRRPSDYFFERACVEKNSQILHIVYFSKLRKVGTVPCAIKQAFSIRLSLHGSLSLHGNGRLDASTIYWNLFNLSCVLQMEIKSHNMLNVREIWIFESSVLFIFFN